MTCQPTSIDHQLLKPTFWDLLARNGLALLDEMNPGWEYSPNLDLGRLDQGAGATCLLGQIYGDYEKGLAALGIGYDRDEQVIAESFGFFRCSLVLQPDLNAQYWELTLSIRRLVSQRLADAA